MRPCPWPIEDLLPHRPPMLLLDEALGWDDEGAVAAVTVRPDHPFAETEGVPVHVALELMAQACGVHVGAVALAGGGRVRLGYLLGTRDFAATREWFRFGERLAVAAKVAANFGEMGTYDCAVSVGGETVATARLNLYQPNEDA